MPVVFVDSDREVYLDTLAEQCRRFDLQIDAYCLTTNHVHLVGRRNARNRSPKP